MSFYKQPAWSEDAVLAWAQQQNAKPIADAEVQQLCRLCSLTTEQLQQLIKANLNMHLSFNEENTTWTLTGDAEKANTCASVDVSELSKLIATFPRFLGWSSRSSTVDELSSDQRASVVKLARMAFAAAPESVQMDASDAADDLLDPMTAVAVYKLATGKHIDSPEELQQIREVWSVEVVKLRTRALKKLARSSVAPERRSARATKPPAGFYDIKASFLTDEASEVPAQRSLSRPKKNPADSSNFPDAKRVKQSAEDIQNDITATKEIIRINAPSNRPDPAYLVRVRDFIPLVLPKTGQEPSHAIVEPRVVKAIKKNRHQAQSFWEYAVDGYPVPVDAERWLATQQQKYIEWLQASAGCKSVTVENVVQLKPCLVAEPYGLPMCRGCLGRQTDMYCAFRNIRAYTKLHAVLGNGEEFTRYLMVPMFLSDAKAAKHKLSVALLNIPPAAMDRNSSSFENWAEFYNLFMTARTLQHTLDMLSHVLGDANEQPVYADNSTEYGEHPVLKCSSAPCVYRALALGSRQFCDICRTSILSTYFACSMCMQEVCPQCFAEWDDSQQLDKRVYSIKAQPLFGDSKRHIYTCKRIARAVKPVAFHSRQQFVRVSQFVPEDKQRVQAKVQQILAYEHLTPTIDCCGILDAQELEMFHAKIQRICQRTRHSYEHQPWELPVVYVEPDELSTAEFSRLWRRGIVVVVQGLLQTLDGAIWKPDWWISNFGFEMVNVLDCSSNGQSVGEWPLRDFYRLFDGQDSYAHMFDADMEDASNWMEHRAAIKQGILKLKDWPPAEDFQTRLPDHFANFIKALPFPEYTQRDGAFNLANQLPAEFVPPDLGPKMYCAYGSNDQEGGVGTTNLHCDMADAVNIMAYAAQTSEDAAAVWDIYPPEAIADLRQFIYDTAPNSADIGDPIHDQATYLTQPMRQAVYKKYGRSCYHIHQNPGDAVFVPAGCAHQVCNYSSAVKIAMDFVSPERVEYCYQLTQEFRKLPPKHQRNRDLLQLNSILWWLFAGNQKQEAV
ncbi:hypothetical protein IWW36_003856 [Coemansia brasiliensis]|uniref:JmjC domain-containing protein n=1 Tax=Coemansia brasiliensis TaxID=2650707 RepID=A0A9W8LZM0_9FUNG|nr:hypothetical protein IWW36_003856 [Coemansia brasiliensis]